MTDLKKLKEQVKDLDKISPEERIALLELIKKEQEEAVKQTEELLKSSESELDKKIEEEIIEEREQGEKAEKEKQKKQKSLEEELKGVQTKKQEEEQITTQYKQNQSNQDYQSSQNQLYLSNNPTLDETKTTYSVLYQLNKKSLEGQLSNEELQEIKQLQSNLNNIEQQKEKYKNNQGRFQEEKLDYISRSTNLIKNITKYNQ